MPLACQATHKAEQVGRQLHRRHDLAVHRTSFAHGTRLQASRVATAAADAAATAAGCAATPMEYSHPKQSHRTPVI
eukprot:365203-Chlamydomonas_euryale.AAC.29